jgi:murein DD-endopeptidase MepM/ murein hydrolase activator NlpD
MAVISSNIFRTISDTKQQTASSKRNIAGISNILSKRITDRKNVGSSIRLFKERRIQIGKRKALQDRVSAPTVVTKVGGARSLAQSSSGTSLKDRLFGFIGYLSAGWILGNLPTWIALGEQFTGRIVKATSILSNYGDETMKVISSLGEILQSAFINLANLDFTDSSFLVRSSFQDLITNIDGLGVGINEAFAVLTEPFKNIPKIGDISQEPDAYNPPPPSQPSVGGGNADFWTLVAVASREDSDPQGQADVAQSIYNRAKSSAYGSKNIRQLILRDGQYAPTWEYPKKKAQQTPNKEWYQITDAESAAKATGFNVSTIQNVAKNITNPSLQKKAAEFVGGRTDFKGVGVGRPPSIQRKDGDNWFGWEYNYRGTQTASVPDFGTTATPPVAKSTPQVSGKLTTSVVGEVDVVGNTNPTVGRSGGSGEYLSRGGSHKGIDIGTSYQKGYYVAFRQTGKVIFAGWDGGGYGNLVVIQSGNLEFYFAHLAKVMVKSGSPYNGETIGEIGNTGRSRGEHLHYEVRKGGRHINPEPYLGLLAIGKSLRTTSGQIVSAAPVASLKPEAPGTAKATPTPAEIEMQNYNDELFALLTTERTGRKIVVIDDRQSTLPQILQSGSDSGDYISVNEFDLVNTFIKNKLLLDLNYL